MRGQFAKTRGKRTSKAEAEKLATEHANVPAFKLTAPCRLEGE